MSKKQTTIADLVQVLEKQEKTITELTNMMMHHQEMLAYLTSKKEEKPQPESINYDASDITSWMEIMCNFYHLDLCLLVDMMSTLQRYNSGSFMSMVIGTVARALDNCYPDSIKNCDTIFVINNLTGKICSVSKNDIRSYRYFGGFRSYKEAAYAISVWQNLKKFIESVIAENAQH